MLFASLIFNSIHKKRDLCALSNISIKQEETNPKHGNFLLPCASRIFVTATYAQGTMSAVVRNSRSNRIKACESLFKLFSLTDWLILRSLFSFHGDDCLWSRLRLMRACRRIFPVHEQKMVFQQYVWQLSLLRREVFINKNNSFL